MHKSNLRHEPYEAQLNKNAGFSLIELLIAVIILAIIVIPFSRAFVVSSRMNGNSRRLQRATTVAQDIVEGLKAYNIDELNTQFRNPLDGFYIVDSRLVHGYIGEYAEGQLHDPHYSGNPDDPGVYYFAMEDFEIQGVAYDALIKVDASVYEAGNLKSDDPNNRHDNPFNASNMAKPGSVIKGRDGSYSQPASFTRAVLDEIKERYSLDDPAAPADPSDPTADFSFKTFKNVGGKFSRTITVNIRKHHDEVIDGNTVAHCEADITFEYVCEDSAGNVQHIYGRATSPVGEINGNICATDITSGNFYLFYYPCYDAKVDRIIINNESGEPFQIFIVKQIEVSSELDAEGNPKPMLSDAQLNSAETNYHAIVNIKDSTNNTDNTVIRTNLGMNLVNSTFLAALSGGSVRDPNQMPTVDVEKQDLISQAKYQFNKSDTDDVSDDPGVNVFGLAGTRFRGSGGSSKKTEVIFDIEVSIYRQGAYAADFPDTERMVVIEGSKNN